MLEPDFDLAKNLYLTNKDSSSTYGRKRNRIKESPVIIWKESYEKNPAEFLDLIQEVSNCLLLNGPSLYDDTNPNHAGLFDVAAGKIKPEDYLLAEYAYGERGAAPVRDNNFFYSAKNHTISQIVQQGFQFQCKNIDNQYSQKKIYDNEKITRKLMKTLLAQKLKQEQGIEMGFMEDKSLNLQGNSKNEIIDNLFGQEQLELVVWKLLQDMNYRHNIENLGRKCFDNKLDVNAQFAYINIVDGDIIPEHIHPDNIRWIAGKPIETLEDRSVSAASVISYLTFNELINKHSMKLNTGTGPNGLIKAIEELIANGNFRYDPEKPYFSEVYKANSLTTNISDQNDNKYNTYGRADYMKSIFYPYRRSPYGIGHSILEHKMFFKVQTPQKFVMEINGKPATDKKYKEWRESDFHRELIADFKQLATDEKAPKGSYVVEKYKEELWEATQLGHNTLVDVGRYKYTAKKKRNNDTYVGMPIVGQISRNKSFVLVGEHISRWINILHTRIEEILNLTGLSSALMIDESIMSNTDAKSILYNAKKTGILMFNSAKMAGGNSFTGEHLSMLKMGHHIEEINNMLAMIGIFTEMYNRMVGSSEQAQGVSQPYDGLQQTRMNIANQSQLKADNFYEHTLFMNQVLQRAADIGKHIWAEDGYRNITLMNGERQVLKLTKEMNLGDYDIYMESGGNMRAKKQAIDQAVMQALSSGGIDMIEPLINVIVSDTPGEALAIFRKSRDLILQSQAAQQKAQQEQAMALAQANQQKVMVPVEVEKIRSATAIQVTDMKVNSTREAENFKGQMADINENNDRSKKVMDTDLAMEIQSHKAALENKIPDGQ